MPWLPCHENRSHCSFSKWYSGLWPPESQHSRKLISVTKSLLLCCCLVAKWCPTLSDPMGCNPPGSSVQDFPGKNTGMDCHFVSRGSSQPRDWTHVSCLAGRWATWEARVSTSEQFFELSLNRMSAYDLSEIMSQWNTQKNKDWVLIWCQENTGGS